MEYHELLKACSNIKLQLSKEDVKLIEEDIRNQAAGSQFFHHRAGRIGAPVSKQASHTDPAQPSKSLILKQFVIQKFLNFQQLLLNMGVSTKVWL